MNGEGGRNGRPPSFYSHLSNFSDAKMLLRSCLRFSVCGLVWFVILPRAEINRPWIQLKSIENNDVFHPLQYTRARRVVLYKRKVFSESTAPEYSKNDSSHRNIIIPPRNSIWKRVKTAVFTRRTRNRGRARLFKPFPSTVIVFFKRYLLNLDIICTRRQ